MSRVVMTEEMWGALSSFDWATMARKNWRDLPESARRAVALAAMAEEMASAAYVAADMAVDAEQLPLTPERGAAWRRPRGRS